MCPFEQTSDEFEKQFQVNYLSKNIMSLYYSHVGHNNTDYAYFIPSFIVTLWKLKTNFMNTLCNAGGFVGEI